MNLEKLKQFVAQQKELWEDLNIVEQECLASNERLTDWLQEELLTLARMIESLPTQTEMITEKE